MKLKFKKKQKKNRFHQFLSPPTPTPNRDRKGKKIRKKTGNKDNKTITVII